MKYNFTSCKVVLAKVHDDLNIQSNIRTAAVIGWIGEAMARMRITQTYIPKVEKLKVIDYRAILPCDFHLIDVLQYNQYAMKYDISRSDGNYHTKNEKKINQAMYSGPQYGYTIQFPYINVNFKSGELILSYMAIPTDEDGLPLVPDDDFFIEACFLWILYKLKTPDYYNGNLSFNEWTALKRAFTSQAKQAMANSSMPSPDEVESIMKSWNRLVTLPNDHKYMNYFSNFNEKV